MAGKHVAIDPSSGTRAGYQRGAIIQGKILAPALTGHVVARPRLERLLAALIDGRKVVILAATAGAGKTTAIARAAELLHAPVAWLTVDRTDAAPGRLLVYLEAALSARLPHLQGVATDALGAGIPHAEAAGLLADAVDEEPVILVLDDLERLGSTREAWSVIEALIRFAPPAMRLVLASRREIPTHLCELPMADSLAVLTEPDLAFTEQEAAEVLDSLGETDLDPAGVVEVTGGWVTGVLFEAWRSSGHVPGIGGEADALHGYLASHILGQLAHEDQDFLVTTALLPEVSAESATALGIRDGTSRLASLRMFHLPVSWDRGGRAMRCHPRFREYLLERMLRRDEPEVRALRLAYGRLLAREGHDEEAVAELLAAGAPAEAVAAAERAIVAVLERLDFALAERWVAELGSLPRSEPSGLTIAELMLAVARGDYRRATETGDRLARSATRDMLAAGSQRGAALMAWSYVGAERLEDAEDVLSRAEPGPEVDAVRYALDLLYGDGEHGRPATPRPAGGPLDALAITCSFHFGRLSELTTDDAPDWVRAVSRPRGIAALCATGRVRDALAAFDEAEAAGTGTEDLFRVVGPEILIDAEQTQRARNLLERGRQHPWVAAGPAQRLMPSIIEAKLCVRLERDPAAARQILDELESEGARRFRLLAELIDTWYGLALLLANDDAPARARLRRAVDGMLAGDRILELPTAAVYLAEAHWRAGDEESADRAADVALEAASRQGSNHILLKALADFPAVVSRRLDAEPDVDSPWHAVGRALIAQDVRVAAPVRPEAITFHDLGRPVLQVGGGQRRPRIAKSYELLAYLLTARGAAARRDQLLDALFGGRADESARAYLRQAVHQLRTVLPDGTLEAGGGRVGLRDDVPIVSDAARFEEALAEAARLQGEERLAATRAALALYDRGEYLEGIESPWIDERRRELADLADGARYEAGELALAAGIYEEAEAHVEALVRSDPLRESGWRLKMRIA
ncbi:MAG: winged helix-turn-helix domain-containing protein, partial [Solirubrobacterales bacterium]|nr:winged helix-turn-helix domain-containing protein [Solirubrobacterales bacterium]